MTISSGSRIARVRTSEAVVDHILAQLFAGELREGDRVDLDALADVLGVSRVPIREALAQLERDGIVTRPHHRGTFISAFDAATIREAFELYALLSGLSSSRVADRQDGQVLATLRGLAMQVQQSVDESHFEGLAREFRRVVNLAGGGPHLRALMRTFRGLVPAAARLNLTVAMEAERRYVAQECEAISRGSAEEAARVAIEHIRYSGQCAVDGLVERGVLHAERDADPEPDRRLLSLIESMRGGD